MFFLDDLIDAFEFLEHWRFMLSAGAGLGLGIWALVELPESVFAWCVFGVALLSGVVAGYIWEKRAK